MATEILTEGIDESLERVKDAWRPRLLANGVEPTDYETTVGRIRTWNAWPAAWVELAGEHEARAEEADEARHAVTAAGFRRLAALAVHFAHFASPLPLDDWLQGQRRKAALFRLAAPLLDPPAEWLRVPFEGITLPAYLRKPRGVDHPPVVLFISGLDSSKEEHTTFEDVLLRRGLATFTFDGPGQGEVWEHMPGRVDWEKAASATVDFLETRSDLDASRVGAIGVSLGGYLAPRSAALEARIRAVVACGGRYNQGERDFSDRLHLPRWQHFWRIQDLDRLKASLDASTLEGVIQGLTQPLLVIHGARDTLAPAPVARRIYDEAPSQDKQWVLYPDGNHVCNNLPHLYRPLAADWLADRLA